MQLIVEKLPLLWDDQPGSHKAPEIKVMLFLPSLRRESPHEPACEGARLPVLSQSLEWSQSLQALGWRSADVGSCLLPTVDMGHSMPQRGTEGLSGTPADCP